MLLRTYALSALVGILIVGCTPIKWYKPGATQHDYNMDVAHCKMEATKATAGYVGYGLTAIGQGVEMGMIQNDVVKYCLQSKGWVGYRGEQPIGY